MSVSNRSNWKLRLYYDDATTEFYGTSPINPMEFNELRESWLRKLYDFREQGLHISDVNPISALAEHIEEEIYKGKVTADGIQEVINLLSKQIWHKTVKNLRMQTQVESSETDNSIPELSKVDITKPIYRAMFTAHPVFALRSKASKTLSEMCG